MLQSFLSRTQQEIKISPFTVDDIPGFPSKEYNDRIYQYRTWEQWYDGTKLHETDVQQGKDIELYPAHINPLPGSCLKHAHTLFGELVDDGSPLVSPKLVKANKISNETVLEIETMMRIIWSESSGRALQYTNGLISQIYGGAIFKADYLPQDKFRTYPIRISKCHPMNFMGILRNEEEYRFAEAWYVKNVSAETAQKYGVDVDANESALWVQYWNPEEIKTTINGKVIRRSYNGFEKEFHGKNPFGEVPVVYIPHERNVGLWGNSLIDGLIGLVREINARSADLGDAISDDSHELMAIRNSSKPKIIKIGNREYLDLGSSQSAVGISSGDPDLLAVSGSKSSQVMSQMVDDLYAHYRRAAYVPAVADGEDEGSQRSGMTLAFRMWPLTSHVSTERIFWTDGLNHFTRVILELAKSKNLIQVSDEAIRSTIRQEWAPMLPRDREAMVNEAVQRLAAGLGSPQAMLRLLGDVEDIEAELELIKEWKKYLSEVESVQQEWGNNVGSTPDNSVQNNPSKAQAKITKET